MSVTEAFTGIKYVRVSGWELWPVRKSLDGSVYLCRWCAKPLSGQRTSYCSPSCEQEIQTRATIPGARRFAIHRAAGKCEDCGIVLDDLEQAFDWYRTWFNKSGIKTVYDRNLKQSVCTDGWHVTPDEFRASCGFKSYGHIWEVNHKIAIAEGGDPTDPSNWEVLCLRCHRKHTRGVVRRVAKAKREDTGIIELPLSEEEQ